MPEKLEIHIVSDSTGDTAARVARAATHQYEDVEIDMVRHARVQTEEQLARALDDATGRPAVVFYTLVDSALREAIVDLARRNRLVTLDVLSPALHAITTASGTQATMLPGRTAPLDAQYFRRIAAIEFAVKHDDGRGSDDLNHAEIVLRGRVSDVKNANLDASRVSRLHGRQRSDRARDRSASRAVLVDPGKWWASPSMPSDWPRSVPAECGHWRPEPMPGMPDLSEIYDEAGARLVPSPAAGLPGDRRLGAGDGRGRRPRCRAGQQSAGGRPGEGTRA